MSILDDLVKSIESRSKPVVRHTPRPMQNPRRDGIAKSGAGGIIFDFSGVTGNLMIDQYNRELQHHADGTQMAIATSQHQEFAKALGDFVEKGEEAFNSERMAEQGSSGIAGGWHKQLSGSTDQQVVEAFKKGELDCNENQSGPAGGGQSGPNRFAKSTIKIGGEDIKATSETDAALIEMMKGGHFDEDSEN